MIQSKQRLMDQVMNLSFNNDLLSIYYVSDHLDLILYAILLYY